MKCRPKTYMVLSGDRLTFGWKCRCGVVSRRFKDKARRDADLADHRSRQK